MGSTAASNSCSLPEELEQALLQSLTRKGVLQKLVSELRKQILECLKGSMDDAPSLIKENQLINSLICEYLEYNGYLCTKSVLLTESNQTSPITPRKFLEHDLSLSTEGEATSLPLLYSIVFHEPEKNETLKKVIRDLVKNNKTLE